MLFDTRITLMDGGHVLLFIGQVIQLLLQILNCHDQEIFEGLKVSSFLIQLLGQDIKLSESFLDPLDPLGELTLVPHEAHSDLVQEIVHLIDGGELGIKSGQGVLSYRHTLDVDEVVSYLIVIEALELI
jgi:hypothetical protein